MKKKYTIPVIAVTKLTQEIGSVQCSSIEDYYEKARALLNKSPLKSGQWDISIIDMSEYAPGIPVTEMNALILSIGDDKWLEKVKENDPFSCKVIIEEGWDRPGTKVSVYHDDVGDDLKGWIIEVADEKANGFWLDLLDTKEEVDELIDERGWEVV